MEAILKREIVVSKTACRIIGAGAFIALTAMGAFVRIPLPFTPVPFTLQTFFVLLCGAFLGGGLGASTQAAYVLIGVAGVSVFTGAGSGLLYIFGPTGGYLLGFILAALFSGKFIRRVNGFIPTFLVLCAADFIILSSGAVWLKLIFRSTWQSAALMGFAPFVMGDLTKAFIATAIYLKLKNRIREIF